MREIKFRARLKELTKGGYEEFWHYFNVIDGGPTTAEIISIQEYTGYKMFNEDVYFDDLVSNNCGTEKEVIRKIVLFEGDMIMETVKGNSRLPKRISLHEHYQLNYKVIGNIYENNI